jgi:hypothetical protein
VLVGVAYAAFAVRYALLDLPQFTAEIFMQMMMCLELHCPTLFLPPQACCRLHYSACGPRQAVGWRPQPPSGRRACSLKRLRQQPQPSRWSTACSRPAPACSPRHAAAFGDPGSRSSWCARAQHAVALVDPGSHSTWCVKAQPAVSNGLLGGSCIAAGRPGGEGSRCGRLPPQVRHAVAQRERCGCVPLLQLTCTPSLAVA